MSELQGPNVCKEPTNTISHTGDESHGEFF